MSNPDDLLGAVSAILGDSAAFDDSTLKVQLTTLELVREPLLRLRVTRYRELCEERERLRHPVPEKGEPRLTDLDRTTMLNAAVAELQEQYEYTKGLEDLVKERIAILKELL